MKNLLIIALAFILFTGSAHAKNKVFPDLDIKDSVSLYIHNNASQVTWTSLNNMRVAHFQLSGYLVKAFFDENGHLLSTTRILKNKRDLPENILNALDRTYSSWGMYELIEENGIEPETVYYARLTDGRERIIVRMELSGKISEFKK